MSQETSVRLHITNICNKEGEILLSVYQGPSEFAYDPEIWYEIPKTELHDSTIVFTFDLPYPGKYALAVLDDENSNGKMDKNFLGIPLEGYGFSNNYRAKGLKVPDFEDLIVPIKPGNNEMTIQISHWKLF